MKDEYKVEAVEGVHKPINNFREKYKEKPKKKEEPKTGEFVALLRKKYDEKNSR